MTLVGRMNRTRNSVGRMNVRRRDVAIPWYLAGGINPSNCIAAYQPKGAADYTTSKVNIANPGTYDAVEGVAPAWDEVNGWTGNGTTNSRWLDTGITIAGGYSIIARVINSGSFRVTGHYFDGTQRYTIYPVSGTLNHVFEYGNSGARSGSGTVANGVLAVTPTGGYVDGSLTVNLSAYTWTGTQTTTFPILARRRTDLGTLDEYYIGSLAAIAFYNIDIASYVSSLTTAMNLL